MLGTVIGVWSLGFGVKVLGSRFRDRGFGVQGLGGQGFEGWDSGFIVGSFAIGISLASSTRSIIRRISSWGLSIKIYGLWCRGSPIPCQG